MLKLYEKQNISVIEPWSRLEINDVQLGYDPNMELDMRNQAAAHTDCLLNYKVLERMIKHIQ